MENIIINDKKLNLLLDYISYGHITLYEDYWNKFARNIFNNVQEIIPKFLLKKYL